MMLLIEQRLKSHRGDWSKKVSLCRVSTTVERSLAVQQQQDVVRNKWYCYTLRYSFIVSDMLDETAAICSFGEIHRNSC